MSKQDKVNEKIDETTLKEIIMGADLDSVIGSWYDHQEVTRQKIKKLFLDLIGNDEPLLNNDTAKDDRNWFENRFRAELREKINKL